MSTDTSWIVEGAECVVYSYGGGIRPAWARLTRVTAVNRKTFRVDGYNHLIQLDSQTHQGGTWDPSTHVIPIDDPRAQVLLREEVTRQYKKRAAKAVNEWENDCDSPVMTRRAMEALRAYYDDLALIAQHTAAAQSD